MKNTKKRIICLLLAIVFMLGVQPTAMSSSGPSFSFENGVLTVSGSGTVPYTEYAGKSSVTKIVFNEGISVIDNAAFQNYTNLREVSLPSSLTKIESYAFDGCSSLTTVNYAGTEAQKNSIEIKSKNNALNNAQWIYSGAAETGSYSLSFTSAEVVQGQTATVELRLDNACEGLGARLVVKAEDGSDNILPISAVNIGTSLSGAVNRDNNGTVVISYAGALAAGTVLASISFDAATVGSYELSVSGEMHTGADNSPMEFTVTPGTITVKNPTVSVTWKNYDGSVLKTEEVELGSTPTYSGAPVRGSDTCYTYSFAGWTPAVSAVSEDTVYIANFTATERTYSVKLDCGIESASVSIFDSDGNALKPNTGGSFSLLATKTYRCVIDAVGYKSKELDISISDSSLDWTFSGDSAILKIDALELAKGDMNDDGIVDATDAQALYNYLAGNYDLDADGFAYSSGKIVFNFNVADINGNERVGADDILPMLELVSAQG